MLVARARVRVRIDRRAVLVDVRVRVLEVAVPVAMDVVVAAVPADEQPHGDRHDHDPDGELGSLLDGVGQVGPEEDDRHAECEQRHGVPQAPCQAKPPGAPRAVRFVACDKHRDRREVIGVGRMAQAEQQRDEQREQPAAIREVRDPLVEPEHQPCALAAATAACP
jgi:hypothetical protein